MQARRVLNPETEVQTFVSSEVSRRTASGSVLVPGPFPSRTPDDHVTRRGLSPQEAGGGSAVQFAPPTTATSGLAERKRPPTPRCFWMTSSGDPRAGYLLLKCFKIQYNHSKTQISSKSIKQLEKSFRFTNMFNLKKLKISEMIPKRSDPQRLT